MGPLRVHQQALVSGDACFMASGVACGQSRAPCPLSGPLHIFCCVSHFHLPGLQSKMTAKPINVVTANKRAERHIFKHSRPAQTHTHAYVNTRCEDVSTSQAWCSGCSVEERARMCSAKLQQTVNIIAGENEISKESLTVSDVDSCFNSSHTTVRYSSVIIWDKRRRINISTPQKDKISKMCQSSEYFQFWFLEVKYEAAGLVAKILKEWNNLKKNWTKHNTYRDSAPSLSPRSGALWPSSWTAASCHHSHLSCLSSLWRKKPKKIYALTLNISNTNVLYKEITCMILFISAKTDSTCHIDWGNCWELYNCIWSKIAALRRDTLELVVSLVVRVSDSQLLRFSSNPIMRTRYWGGYAASNLNVCMPTYLS